MTFRQAARELRTEWKRSQQSMATSLGLSMAALRNYESGTVKVPGPRIICAYLISAYNCGRSDLEIVFLSALRRSLALPATHALEIYRRHSSP